MTLYGLWLGYEPPCAAAFDAYARARFNASTLRACFGVHT
jgi:hypothetical protein